MPSVNIPNIGIVNFPEAMSMPDIERAIRDEIIPNFQRQQGVAQAEPAGPQQLPVPERGFFGTIAARAGDVAGSGVSGAGGIVSGVGGLAGMAGAGFDNPLSRAGRGIREYGESLMSPELQNKRAAFAQALSQAESQGFVAEAATAARELASNPGLLASMAIEQIPQFLASFGIGRGALAVGQRIGGTAEAGRRAAVGAAIGSAAGLQGGDIAGQTYEDVMNLPAETIQQSPNYQTLLATMSPQEARESLATRAGREAGLMAGSISAATTALLPGVERAAFSKNLSRSAIARALGTGAGEAVGEAIEEGGGQAAQNLAASRADTERDLMRGVGGAAATGAILGGAMGAGVGAISAPPVDLEEARRAELRGAIGDVVGAREPEPQAPAPQPDRSPERIAQLIDISKQRLEALNTDLRDAMIRLAEARTRQEVDPDEVSGIQREISEINKQAKAQNQNIKTLSSLISVPRTTQVTEPGPRAAPFQPGLPIVAPQADAGPTPAPVVAPVQQQTPAPTPTPTPPPEVAPVAEEVTPPPAPVVPETPPTLAPITPAGSFNVPVGQQYTVRTPDNSMAIDVVPQVVDLSTLIAATGRYQNRDITQKANQQTIAKIENAPDFTQLTTTPFSDRGTPVVGEDNIIEVGNHRVEGLKRAAQNNPEGFAKYVNDLRAAGYDTTGMQFPVLIRRRVTELDPETRSLFVRLSNAGSSQSLNEVEIAKQDAQLLTPELLAKFDGEVTGGVAAAKNAPFVRDFLSKITTPDEFNKYLTAQGSLSSSLEDRINNALFAYAYDDDILIKKAIEKKDDDSRSITSGMIAATGAMNALKRGIESGRIRPEFDIVPFLVTASDRIRAGKNNGMTPSDVINSDDMISPMPQIERSLIRLLSNDAMSKISSATTIGRRLKAYVEEAKTQTPDLDLVGGQRVITPEEAVVIALNPGQGAMFSARRMGEQTQEQGEIQGEETSPSLEKSRAVIKKFLADLRAKGKQGRFLANALEDALKDRRFNADQIYAAFMINDAILKTIPKGADYRFRFLEDIVVDDAEAAKATGAKVGDRAQARVIKPTESLPGFIEISLAEDMLPILNETAAHEAFHVLQDYFGAFDKGFNSLLAKSFRDGMTLDQLEPSIKRRLQGLKAPGSDKSYWDSLKEGLGNNPLSLREAQAYAFGSLTDAAMRGQKVTGLTAPFQRFVNFLRDTFSKLRSGLRGDGYQTVADLLAGAGARAEGFTQEAPKFGQVEFSARKKKNESWAEYYSNRLSAPVVYDDGNVSLIEGATVDGKPVYVGVNKDGILTHHDIEVYSGSQFSGDELAALIKAKKDHLSKVSEVIKYNPNGPFKPGQVAAFDKSFPSDMRGFAEGLMKELGINNSPVFFADYAGSDNPEIGPNNKMYGRYFYMRKMLSGQKAKWGNGVFGLSSSAINPSVTLRAITINFDNLESKELQFETIAHEIGHVFDKAVFRNAPPEQQNAVYDAFTSWLRKNENLPANEYLQVLRTALVGRKITSPNLEGVSAQRLDPYFRKFEEWFADQVAKWSLTSKPAETLLGRFFQQVAAGYRKIIQALGAKGLPDQSVADFIENHRKSIPGLNIVNVEPEVVTRGTPPAPRGEQVTFDFTTVRKREAKEKEVLPEGFGKAPPGKAPQTKFEFSARGVPQQKISSAKTSIAQIPATFKRVEFKPGTRNLDYGGGSYDLGSEFLREKGVENLVYDRFNRSEEHNDSVLKEIGKRGADTVTVNNVLNVVAEPEVRDFIVEDAASYLKPNGTAYFLIYEGDGSGSGKETSKGFQNNAKTESYLPTIKRHFNEVIRKGNLVIAQGVKGAPEFSARKAPSYSAQKPSAPPGTAKSFYQSVIKDVDNSSVLDRILSKILDKKGGESIGSAIARTSINQAAPLYNLDKMARAEGYTGLNASKALEMSMSNSGRIAQMLSTGMGRIDPKTGVISRRDDVKPLLQIMKEAGVANNEGMKEQLQAYLAALRERDLRAAGRKGFTNETIQAVNATIRESEAKNPQWKKTAADLEKLNQALIDWAMATGLITKQQARALMDKFYTPFYREDYEYVTNALGRELKGGEKALNDLFGNIILNADSIMKAGLKNLATKTAIETMEFVKLAKPNTSDKKNDNTITFKVNGKPVNYDVEDAVLFSALSVMPRQMQRGIYQTMANMASFFRDMVTVAPSFIIANLYRGKISAFVQEGQPLTTNTFAGMRDALNASTSLQNFQLQTGFGGLEYGMGARNMAEAFERKLNDQGIIKSLAEGKVIQSMKEAFSKMQELSEASEMAERIKLAENLIKKGMKPEDAYFQGYMLAPYTRKGTGEGWLGATVQFLMPLVPFLNAKIQTTYRLIENEKGDKRRLWTAGIPQQIFLRGLVVTAFSLMAYGLNLADDEDEWDKIPNHMKLEYDMVPFMGNYISLPRAFEIGKIFGALPVFMLDAIRRGEGKDLTEALIEVGKSTFWMNPIPKAVDPILAAVTNYDFFRGRPLETKGDQALPVQERVNRSTTQTGEALSAVVNTIFGNILSPIKAQALLDGYMGTLGVTIMAGFDSLLAAAGAIPGKPAGAFGDPATMPAILANAAGLNRFYREGDMMVSRFVGDFYKIKEMTDQLVRSENLARQANDFQRLQELRGEEGLPLRMRSAVNAAGTQISEINKRIRMIERQDIDGVSKAQAIQPLIDRRDRIAKRVVDQARSMGAF